MGSRGAAPTGARTTIPSSSPPIGSRAPQPRRGAGGRHHQRRAGAAPRGDEAHRHRPGRAALGESRLAGPRCRPRRAERYLCRARRGRGDRGGGRARAGGCAARGARWRHHGRAPPAVRAPADVAAHATRACVARGTDGRGEDGGRSAAGGAAGAALRGPGRALSRSARGSRSPSCSGPRARRASGGSRRRRWLGGEGAGGGRRHRAAGGAGRRGLADDAEQRRGPRADGHPGDAAHTPGRADCAPAAPRRRRRSGAGEGPPGAASALRQADATLDTEGLSPDAVAGALVGLVRSLQGPLVRPGMAP